MSTRWHQRDVISAKWTNIVKSGFCVHWEAARGANNGEDGQLEERVHQNTLKWVHIPTCCNKFYMSSAKCFVCLHHFAQRSIEISGQTSFRGLVGFQLIQRPLTHLYKHIKILSEAERIDRGQIRGFGLGNACRRRTNAMSSAAAEVQEVWTCCPLWQSWFTLCADCHKSWRVQQPGSGYKAVTPWVFPQ